MAARVRNHHLVHRILELHALLLHVLNREVIDRNIFFFQVLVDGWLTRLDDPVVRYTPGMFLGVRFPFSIPIEDFGFGFALVTAVIITWKALGRREVRE